MAIFACIGLPSVLGLFQIESCQTSIPQFPSASMSLVHRSTWNTVECPNDWTVSIVAHYIISVQQTISDYAVRNGYSYCVQTVLSMEPTSMNTTGASMPETNAVYLISNKHTP